MIVPVLPESAPFTVEQRAWLNGFFAGLFGSQQVVQGQGAPALLNGHAAPAPLPAAPAVEESFPWHDPAMPMTERLKLAEGKPTERVLMAAMAQLDCGACGYICKSYGEAIASGAESDLSKCSPGGKETSKKLKELVAARKALPMADSKVAAVSVNGNGHLNGNGHAKPVADRKHPIPAPLLTRMRLTHDQSEKDVRFVAINLKESGLKYDVGDALGVYPENCPDLVESVLKALGARGDEICVTPDGRQVFSYEALVRDYAITRINDRFLTLLAESAADASEAGTLRALLDSDPTGVLEWWDVLDLLEQFPSAQPPVPDMIAALSPLQPRLYSISSSLKAHPDEVHLTVGVVSYEKANRVRKGVASTYLTELLRPRQRLRVFVHPSHGFRVPVSGETPMIMVGPGTGIAPFRAFLEERRAEGAKGKNWLFFGDQRRDYDFLYRDELDGYVRDGLLSRLDTAFSRDQQSKIYVQHRMMDNAPEIWKWLEQGAHFYVCGDARRMALDVDHALHAIVAREGHMSAEAANDYVKNMSKSKRYQRDVY